MSRAIVTGVLLLTAAVSQDAVAQRRTPGQSPATGSEVSIMARLGSKSYTASVRGSCKHESSASIYDLPAALWMVEAEGTEGSQVRRLNLTLWRPKNGSADQISLSLDAGSSSTRIDLNPRNKPVGSATIQLQPEGSGGKFELEGKNAKGTPISLTISCPRFEGIEAAGG